MDYRLLIDGELVRGNLALDVINPATGLVFASAARADAAQLEQAIDAGQRAFPDWSRRSYVERSAYLQRFAAGIEVRLEEFAHLLTREQGKPLVRARHEMTVTIAALRYYAAQDLQPRVLRASADELVIEQRHAQGVVAAISSWNFPVILLMHKVGAALISGNCVIAKPAPTTPLTTLLMGMVAASTLPPGVFQTIVDQNDLGTVLSSHPGIAHVSFTGSTATGKKVLNSTADTLKRFSLELGGNDAAIILDDADVKQVAPKIFNSAMLNAGQICFASKRVYVPRAMLDSVCAEFVRLAGEARVGDGMDPATTVGPVQNRAQYERLLGYIAEARTEGTILAGGNAVGGGGYFIAPTIVRDLPDTARLVREEQFGPVMPVLAYDNEDEMLARVNNSEYGLGGTIWTGSAQRGIALAERIETGTVWVNRHMALHLDVAFGGVKQSGVGQQQGIAGIEEFTDLRVVSAALN